MSKKDARSFLENVFHIGGFCSDCRESKHCKPLGNESCPDDEQFMFNKKTFKNFMKKLKLELDK